MNEYKKLTERSAKTHAYERYLPKAKIVCKVVTPSFMEEPYLETCEDIQECTWDERKGYIRERKKPLNEHSQVQKNHGFRP